MLKKTCGSAVIEDQAKQIMLDAMAEEDRRFLKSWKVAVNKLGPELFNVKSPSVDAAVDKNELLPNFKAIAKHVHSIHDDHHYFLYMVVSFYSFIKIEGIFASAGVGVPRVVDLQLLNETERMIIYSLVETSDIEW